MTGTFHLKDIVINHTEGEYRHDQKDRLYHQPRSLLLSESGKDTSYEDIMPEVENRGDTDFKATRKLRVFNDTPVTSSSSFKQEFLHRLDNITCMAKLFSSPVGSLCHTRGVVRRPSCVVCVHHNYQK